MIDAAAVMVAHQDAQVAAKRSGQEAERSGTPDPDQPEPGRLYVGQPRRRSIEGQSRIREHKP